MNTYPHMCRDGHLEIGFADWEDEMCPVCQLLDIARRVAEHFKDTDAPLGAAARAAIAKAEGNG